MKTVFLALTLALASAVLPQLNPQRHMIVTYSQKVVSEHKTYDFMEHHYYDVQEQLSRIDSINATSGAPLVTKLDRPIAEGLSYYMDYKKPQCIEWDFKAAITGFAEFSSDMTVTEETMDGVACEKWSKTISASPSWTYTVWLSKAAPQVPVAVYSSNWEQNTPTGDTFDDGMRHISHYNETNPPGIFDPKFPVSCTKPPSPPLGKCDQGSSTCQPCTLGDAGCQEMSVCEVQVKHSCGPIPGKDGYSCDWATHTCKPDPTIPGQGKDACEAMCHP